MRTLRIALARPGAAFGLFTVLALTAVGPSAAQQAPAPQGVAALLRAADLLPRGTPPAATEVVLQDGQLTLTRQALTYRAVPVTYKVLVHVPVTVTEEVTVTVNGQPQKQQRTVVRHVPQEQTRTTTVTEVVPQTVRQTVPLQSVKAFRVGPKGRLEPLDRDRLADALKKSLTALVGDGEPDARALDLIRPGVVYLSVPPAEAPGPGAPGSAP
jgi:hypothetical protein